MSAIVWYFEHSLALPFFGNGMKTDLFQSCSHCCVFQICSHSWCSAFTASPFRIWNSSTGIPSPPLASFLVMLPKAHLTSYSRISGLMSNHTIVIIWVMKILFVQFLGVFLPPLLNIFCFCWVHTISVLCCACLCMKCSLGISNFVKRSLVFPILLFSSISLHWSLRKAILAISPCYSLELCIQMGVSFLFSFAFHFSYFHSYL